MLTSILRAVLIYPFGTSIFSLTCFLDENNQIPVSTEDMGPEVATDNLEEPEVISDSGADERYNDYPMDIFFRLKRILKILKSTINLLLKSLNPKTPMKNNATTKNNFS